MVEGERKEHTGGEKVTVVDLTPKRGEGDARAVWGGGLRRSPDLQRKLGVKMEEGEEGRKGGREKRG